MPDTNQHERRDGRVKHAILARLAAGETPKQISDALGCDLSYAGSVARVYKRSQTRGR